ncbi:MAG: hypothetical protein AAF741_04645 [Bacteroidota bacterium]
MKELNKDRLCEALNRLPTYQPDQRVWPGIVRGLQAKKQSLDLPEYSPPTQVWNNINQQLDQTGGQQAKVRTLNTWLSRAAAVLLLFSVGYWTANYESGPTVAVQESVETATIRPNFVTYQEDEKSFAETLRELEELNEPTMNQLRYELQELTYAKQDVESMLVSYGQDAQVMRKLADIERQRSAVYRQILAGR